MTNNDILKKLRVALQLRDEQIVDILQLVDFRLSKGEVGNFFRSEDHPKYVECKDQILRNFLNGLVIFLRGTKENPKNPKDVLSAIANDKKPLDKPKFIDNKPKSVNTTKKATFKKNTNFKNNNSEKVNVLGNVRFNNGKPKKKNDQ